MEALSEKDKRDFSYLDKNAGEIRENIRRAADSCSRRAEDITLLAAVKYADAEEIDYIHGRLGICDVGENRVQQLLEHWEKIDRDGLNMHFIGTLQTNKVKYIIDKVCLIHSLDSEKLADEIDRQARKHGKIMDVLIEINSGCEESKSGVLPDALEGLCRYVDKLPNISLKGFMTMAPRGCTEDEYHKYFSETYSRCMDIWRVLLEKSGDPIVSMGMSGNYETAITEGSTLIRVGSGLFKKD